MGIVRAEVIGRMKGAIARGLSASRFIRDMKAKGLSYRRTDMLADWRGIGKFEKKKGLARFVRKGYIPSKYMAHISIWEMSAEYMYRVQYTRTMYPGQPVKPQFTNVMSDKPLTVEEIELEAWERSFVESPPVPGEERIFMVETAIRKQPS